MESIASTKKIPSSDPSVYWESTEARAIFAPKNDETVLEAIQNQIDILRSAIQTYQSISSIVGEDVDNLTDCQALMIHEQCQIISLALISVALNNLPVWQNWNRCCEVAVRIARKMGCISSQNARTVRNWYQEFQGMRKF